MGDEPEVSFNDQLRQDYEARRGRRAELEQRLAEQATEADETNEEKDDE